MEESPTFKSLGGNCGDRSSLRKAISFLESFKRTSALIFSPFKNLTNTQSIYNQPASITFYECDSITIDNSEIFLGTLNSAETLLVDGLVVSSASNMLDDEDPELRITISNSLGDLYWDYILPIDFLSGAIELSHSISNDACIIGAISFFSDSEIIFL